MGRPERPIDLDAGPVAEFASELRTLRDEAGRPSYRELSQRASFSVTALSEAAGGRSLPTLAVAMGYVRACGGDECDWEERWRRAAGQRRDQVAGSACPAPYLGLASYEVEHASLFFGREALTRDLLRRLSGGRFIAVFGPSGGGKSSLLRAGLLATVNEQDAGDWTTVLLTPGELPVTALAARVASLAGTAAESVRDSLLAEPASLSAVITKALDGQGAGDLLLVVDQFEELFTVCRDQRQRDGFVRALLAAITGQAARSRVVLGIRADYYAQCTMWPELVAALRDNQLLVGPMNPDELRDVIVKPAEQAGVMVERALLATAVAETSTEPGALALVSHALLETWRHSPPGRMTLAAYQEAGGISHAIASTADQVYASCDEDERQILRRIFLRLVALGEGSPDARRRVVPGELVVGTDPGTAATLVERLAQARLVTTDDGAVQLAHEALIKFWPRLAEWLAESRTDLRVQRRLAAAAAEWSRLGHDPAALYRGTPLAVARAWAERDAGLTGLTGAEQDFLDASVAAQDAARATTIRAARRLRRLVAALFALLAAVSIAGGLAAWQRGSALSAESAAISGQLAYESAELASVNPDAALLAALASWHARPTVAARSALLSTVACCATTQASLRGEPGTVYSVALAAGGQVLAAGGQDKAVHIWDTASGHQLAVLRGFTGPVRAVAFSPDGALLAAGSADHTIRMWNTVRHTIVRVLAGDTGAIEDLAFDPGRAVLASASADGQIRLWNTATAVRPGEDVGRVQPGRPHAGRRRRPDRHAMGRHQPGPPARGQRTGRRYDCPDDPGLQPHRHHGRGRGSQRRCRALEPGRSNPHAAAEGLVRVTGTGVQPRRDHPPHRRVLPQPAAVEHRVRTAGRLRAPPDPGVHRNARLQSRQRDAGTRWVSRLSAILAGAHPAVHRERRRGGRTGAHPPHHHSRLGQRRRHAAAMEPGRQAWRRRQRRRQTSCDRSQPRRQAPRRRGE
jgi:WD domain, G-beta repeat